MKLKTILVVLVAISYSAFAKSGFEAGIMIPLGLGVGIHNYDKTTPENWSEKDYQSHISNNTVKPFAGFEFAVLFQAGYRLDINRDISLSFLGEIGYSRDVVSLRMKDSNTNSYIFKYQNFETYTFDSLILGVLPKVNIDKLSIGIGGGVKLFLYSTITSKQYNPALDYSTEVITLVENKDSKNYFENIAIPYIKLTADYAVYSSDKVDVVVGGYFGYDFGPIRNRTISDKVTVKENLSSVDMGLQFGVKMKPMAYSKK